MGSGKWLDRDGSCDGLLNPAQLAVGIADLAALDPKALEHSDVEVAEFCASGLEVAAGFELAICPSREDGGDVFGGVLISIADAGAEEDHGVIEEGGVSLGDIFHSLKHVGILLGVPGVDLLVLAELGFVSFMLRDGVVAAFLFLLSVTGNAVLFENGASGFLEFISICAGEGREESEDGPKKTHRDEGLYLATSDRQ